MRKGKRRVWGLLTVALLSLGLVVGGDNVSAVTKEQAESALSSGVYNKMSDNEYVLEGGGTISGKELFNKEGSSNNGVQYTINEDQLKDLESKEQQKFAQEFVENANEQVGENGVTRSTVNNYFQKVQKNPTISSRIIGEAIAGIQPDIGAGRGIMAPVYKPMNIAFGVLVIVLMLLLTFHSIIGVLYATLPSVQAWFHDEGKKRPSFLISKAAKAAVSETEGSESYRSPLWAYIKYSFLEFLAAGLILVLLITGNMWIFVMWIIDIAASFFQG